MTFTRDEPLPCYFGVRTPEEVATHMRFWGKDVGRNYKTFGQVWDDKEALVVGLLHLILSQLETINLRNDETLERHRTWLLEYSKEDRRLVQRHAKEMRRIGRFCDLSLLKQSDCTQCSIDVLYRAYRSYDNYDKERLKIQAKIKILKRVKTLDDIEFLWNIGKKTADKIRAEMLLRSKSTSTPKTLI